MILTQWVARLSSRRAERLASGYLLSRRRFRHAAACERMRVDRNRSVLSLLVVHLKDVEEPRATSQLLARVLEGRLRITDTSGWLSGGRVGVLLPDTPVDGAWKVAREIATVFDSPGEQLKFEVVRYPEIPTGPSWEAGAGSRGSQVGERVGGTVDEPFGAPVATTAVSDGPTSAAFESLLISPMPWWKRATDLVGASLGLLIATPVMLLCAAAVMLTSRGSPFFAQEREGLGGTRFKMYKIRTMRPGAELLQASLRQQSEQDGPAFKMARDPRVTPVGRLLRKLSLDELPQLINVLRGDMSLVGPRPLPVQESQLCTPWQRRRLEVTPGITCIWQATSRNTVAFDEWARMDLQYIQQRSLWRDLKLMLITVPALVFSRGPR